MQSSEIRCEKLFKGVMPRTRIDLLWMAQREEAALVRQSRDRGEEDFLQVHCILQRQTDKLTDTHFFFFKRIGNEWKDTLTL